MECDSMDEFQNKDEVKAQSHGYEPADPAGMEVK
jgi:hypothetical protein